MRRAASKLRPGRGQRTARGALRESVRDSRIIRSVLGDEVRKIMTGGSRRALEAVLKSGGSSDYSGEKGGLSQGVPGAVELGIVHGVTEVGAKPQRGLCNAPEWSSPQPCVWATLRQARNFRQTPPLPRVLALTNKFIGRLQWLLYIEYECFLVFGFFNCL